jgi:AAA15 family ATPase/GTPase
MSQNLEHLTIHQFRGLKNLELRDLGTINLLVGANNSGKTSVLEAIAIYCRPLDPKAWLNTSWSREIKSSRKPQLDALRWLFPQSKQDYYRDFYAGEILAEGEGDFPLRKLEAIYEEIEGTYTLNDIQENLDNELFSEDLIQRGADLLVRVAVPQHSFEITNFDKVTIEQGYWVTEHHFELWESERSVFGKKRSKLNLSVETISPFSHRIEQLQVESLSNAIEQRFKSEIIELLQNLDQGIINLEILSTSRNRKERLYIDHKDIGIAPLSAFGDGVRRLLYIASTLVKAKGGVLLIDELESSIHTQVLDRSFSWLIKACQEREIQLFVTTHSLEAVDAILNSIEKLQYHNGDNNDFNRDLVLYRLKQDESKTVVTRFGLEKLHRLRENLGQEVRW